MVCEIVGDGKEEEVTKGRGEWWCSTLVSLT